MVQERLPVEGAAGRQGFGENRIQAHPAVLTETDGHCEQAAECLEKPSCWSH